jgi:hypothetical protein
VHVTLDSALTITGLITASILVTDTTSTILATSIITIRIDITGITTTITTLIGIVGSTG